MFIFLVKDLSRDDRGRLVLVEYGHGKSYSTTTQRLWTVYHVDIRRYVFEKRKISIKDFLSITDDVTDISIQSLCSSWEFCSYLSHF